MIKLSKRLSAAASFVREGSAVADVGCDHAHLSIALVETGTSPFAVASDVRSGPLKAAKANIEAAGLSDRIAAVICDGIPEDLPSIACRLAKMTSSEAGVDGPDITLVITGMGGLLITDIISRGDVTLFSRMVLSPQRDADVLRRKLRDSGIAIVSERMIEEEGKFYPIIAAEPAAYEGAHACEEEEGLARKADGRHSRMDEVDPARNYRCSVSAARDKYGPCLIDGKDPVLRRYLGREMARIDGIIRNLEENGMTASEAYAKAASDRSICSTALKLMDG